MSIYYVPGVAVDARETAVTETSKVCGHGADILAEDAATA